MTHDFRIYLEYDSGTSIGGGRHYQSHTTTEAQSIEGAALEYTIAVVQLTGVLCTSQYCLQDYVQGNEEEMIPMQMKNQCEFCVGFGCRLDRL